MTANANKSAPKKDVTTQAPKPVSYREKMLLKRNEILREAASEKRRAESSAIGRMAKLIAVP